ncbi:MAG: VPLPA-CTERM sorting domain-containing protein [Aliishimia sp.]
MHHDLTLNPTSLSAAGTYNIGTDPNSGNGNFSSFGDNTSGSGNMMIINGTTTTGTISWGQTVNVIAGQTYSFNIWLANLFPGGAAALDLVVDGVVVNSATTNATTSNANSGFWNEFTGDWLATVDGAIDLQVIETSAAFGGNDYGLDDISFTTEIAPVSSVPLPAGLPLLLAGLGALGIARRTRR